MTHPYRTPIAREAPPGRRRWLLPWCLLTEHRWQITRDAGAHHLMHICTLAGCDAFCARCGETWTDFDAYTCRREVLFGEMSREYAALAEAFGVRPKTFGARPK